MFRKILENGHLQVIVPIKFRTVSSRHRMIVPGTTVDGTEPLALALARAFRCRNTSTRGSSGTASPWLTPSAWTSPSSQKYCGCASWPRPSRIASWPGTFPGRSPSKTFGRLSPMCGENRRNDGSGVRWRRGGRGEGVVLRGRDGAGPRRVPCGVGKKPPEPSLASEADVH